MNFLLALLLATGISQAENLEDLRIARWESRVPNIVICNGADIDQELVERAADAWRARGERFGNIYERSCSSRPNRGEIAIYVRSEMEHNNSVGETVRNVFRNDDGSWATDIHHARVYIKPNYVDSYSLIEHELGHAVGYLDTWNSRSVMYVIADKH